jgi:hypothetical protein
MTLEATSKEPSGLARELGDKFNPAAFKFVYPGM